MEMFFYHIRSLQVKIGAHFYPKSNLQKILKINVIVKPPGLAQIIRQVCLKKMIILIVNYELVSFQKM